MVELQRSEADRVQAEKMRRKIVAILWMLFGSSMVFALLLLMNEYIEAPKPDSSKTVSSFKVEKRKPPQPPKQKTRPKRRKKTRRNRAPQAPLPQLGGSIAGLSLGIPDFDASDVSQLVGGGLGNVKDVVMTEDAVDDPPRARTRSELVYPKRARAKGQEGYVTLSLLIDANGEVVRVKVLEAQPSGVFEEAAIESVKQWSFEPATYKGEAVRVWARQTIRFDLR